MTDGELTGTFLVTHADEETAVLGDVHSGQTVPLSSNPGVDAGDVLVATVAPDPPLEVSWQVVDVAERRTIELLDSDLDPTTHSLEVAAEQPVGECVRLERAGRGEIHVLTVPPGETESAVEAVLEDEGTLERAARLEVVRVEVRRREGDDAGVVSVRYLPE